MIAGRPVRVALIEGSIGLSGSTVSLCALVKRLDPSRFAPLVVVSRPEQAEYARARLGAAVSITRISPRRGCKAAAWARRGGFFARVAAAVDLVLVALPYALALRRFIRSHGIEIVHHNNGFDETTVALCRVLRVPLVAYQRGDEWHSWLVRWLAPLATRYIANSETTRQDLLALGISADMISVIFPPVDLADFAENAGTHPASAPSREMLGIDGAAPCFGVVGQLQGWKGQKVFLRAARQVLEARPDARAWIIGSAPEGSESYAAELHTLAATLGIADRVVFTGFVRDVPAFVRLLDVVVHASTYPEPFGRVIVEAMLVGRPVVASDAGGPREIIRPEQTGLLVPPGDDVAMAKAILRLIEDPPLRARLAEDARMDAIRRFSAVEHARQVAEVYDEALGRAGAVGRRGLAEPAPTGGPQ